MKNSAALILITLFAMITACKEDQTVLANRLTQEAIQIHYSTLQAIFKNDLKVQIDLDEQDDFFVGLRTDMERCRDIEVELRAISSAPKVSELEKLTTQMLVTISEREEIIQGYREAGQNLESKSEVGQNLQLNKAGNSQ